MIDLGHELGTLLASCEIFPGPVPNHHQAQEFKQAWNDRKEINGVEHTFDQDLGNNYRKKNSRSFTKLAQLTPINLVKGFVHLSHNIPVTLLEVEGGFLSIFAGVALHFRGFGRTFSHRPKLLMEFHPQLTGDGQTVPEEIFLSRKVLTVLHRVLQAAAPEEGCALLLGPRWQVRQVWPCCNAWLPKEERHRRFSIDPREQLLAQKWARQRNWVVLGTLHSHPSAPPVPSAIDRALTVSPALLVIQGVSGLACWWLPEEGQVKPLVWKMEP